MKARVLVILLFGMAVVGALGQATDNTIYVKQFQGGDVGTKVANAQATCTPNVPCILVIDTSLATFNPGVMPSLCPKCVLVDNRTPGQMIPRALDGIRFATQFSGADCGARINSAFADLGSTIGQVWAGTCPSISTPINVPSGDGLLFIQGGAVPLYAPITANSNSTVGSQIPSASPGSLQFVATAGTLYPSGLPYMINVAGGEAVLHDLTLDGNASTLPTGAPQCANNGGTAAGSNLINVTSGGGRLQMERVATKCGAGGGIFINGAENVDMSHMEVILNMGRGLSCLNAGDEWISGVSQFDGNGLSGIDLDGCGSIRMVQGDVSTNGSLGSPLTTGCEIYIHATYPNVANSNIFTEVQSGSTNSAVCENSWYPQGAASGQGHRVSYNNFFVGFQVLGAMNSGYPAFSCVDCDNDLLVGTFQKGANSYGVQFSESVAGRALRSRVDAVFVAPYSSANSWNDAVVIPDEFTGSVPGNDQTYYLGPWEYCYLNTANTDCQLTLNGQYSNGTGWNVIEPGMRAGGYMICENIGESQSASYEAASLCFQRNGAGSATNKAQLCAGGPCTSVDGNGNTFVGAGANVVYRCPNSPYRVYWGSTPPSGCGTPVDTGLRVK
jgi:hypothetical protein